MATAILYRNRIIPVTASAPRPSVMYHGQQACFVQTVDGSEPFEGYGAGSGPFMRDWTVVLQDELLTVDELPPVVMAPTAPVDAAV